MTSTEIGQNKGYSIEKIKTMTPREKASELIVSYQLQCKSLDYNEAKQCALIAVDEILKALESDNIIYGSEYRFEENNWWQQVKKEIEKL